MENNKLIAEFMGVKIGVDSYSYRPGQSDLLKEENLDYHKSWGWLMAVVEKIESLDLKEYGYQWEGHDGKTEYNNGSIHVEIERNHCCIWMDLSLDPPHTINEKTYFIDFPTKLEATYAAVVEFIEYYNELITRKDEE
jgi:hypothetical protein